MRIRAFLAALLVALAACKSAEEEQKLVARDLQNYISQVKKWEPKEKAVLKAVAEVQRSQYVDDDFVVRTLRDALPEIRSHIQEVEQYAPDTMDVSELYERYLDAWKDLEQSLHEVIAAMEKKDYIALAKSKTKLETARAGIFTSYVLLDELLQLHDESLKSLKKS